jgi:primosomal protein N' (replication factor Y)
LVEVYASEIGRITLVKLTQRIAGRPLPTATIVDMRDRQARGPNHFLSKPLIAALKETLGQGRQSLLFINRRGSASSQICNHCGTVTLCPRCELPLTFHADELKLICHICNYRSAPAAVCPSCGQNELRYLGGGTKRIEAEIGTLLPSARLARLDRDSADPKLLPQLYKDLHAGAIDILIGTQMVAKGLDLPDLDTVGVINADSVLHMPDFSSAERTFQLLAQVAGRSGRGAVPGRVFIQTRTPEHPTITAAARGDFWGFAATELAQRQQLGYPPYRFLLKMMVSHAQAAAASSQSQAVYARLKQHPGIKVLGPAPAFHERAGGVYHWQLLAKAARRSTLLEVAASLPSTWKTDIDPLNVL